MPNQPGSAEGSSCETGHFLRSSRLLGFAGAFLQRMYCVGNQAIIAFDQAAGPTDVDPIDFICITQPKMHSSIVIGSIACSAADFVHQVAWASFYGDASADAIPVGFATNSTKGDPVIGRTHLVDEQTRRGIHVADD